MIRIPPIFRCCLSRRIPALLLVVLMLAGCQAERDQESEEPAPQHTSQEGSAIPPPAGPTTEDDARADALAQALAERQRLSQHQAGETDRSGARDQLRDQMLERRREVLAGRDGDSETGRRALSPRGNWWEDQTLADAIVLSTSQKSRIAAAASELDRVSTRSRQALATSQRELIQALSTESPELARDLVNQRRQRVVDLAEAEAAWLDELLDTLSAEQLATLISQHPQLIMGRGAVAAGRAER